MVVGGARGRRETDVPTALGSRESGCYQHNERVRPQDQTRMLERYRPKTHFCTQFCAMKQIIPKEIQFSRKKISTLKSRKYENGSFWWNDHARDMPKSYTYINTYKRTYAPKKTP